MGYASQFDLNSKELEQLKREILTKHNCPAGLKVVLYYKTIEHDEKLAKIWIDEMDKCLE
jgi:hypothetical protein